MPLKILLTFLHSSSFSNGLRLSTESTNLALQKKRIIQKVINVNRNNGDEAKRENKGYLSILCNVTLNIFVADLETSMKHANLNRNFFEHF